MKKTLENTIVLKNRYYEYVMGINKDKKLYHICFCPNEISKDLDYNSFQNRLHHPFAFEALINTDFEPLQCSHSSRYFWSLSSYRAIYTGHQTQKINNGEKTIISLLDEEKNIEIKLFYECYEDSPCLRRYLSVKNLSSNDIVINHLSSFVLSNFPYFNVENELNDMHLHLFDSQWSWEGEHNVKSFDELGIYKKWCRKGFTIENNSTWVCQSYLPYFIIEERNSGIYWGIQIEYSGPWRFELGAAEIGTDNWFYAQGGMGNFQNAHWSKTLKPNEIFESIPCSLTTANKSIENIYNNMHQHQSKKLITKTCVDQGLPIIYNDWQYMFGSVNEEKIIDQLDIIKNVGVEAYVIDAGWYTCESNESLNSNWWDKVGDWEFDSLKFPSGPSNIASEITKRGLIPGIWCEIEAVGKFSSLYNKESLLMKNGNFFVEDANRRFLYFGSQGGRDYATMIFEKLIGFGFRYFKIDYNIDSSPGCTNSGDSLGQGLYEHRMGYYQWLDELRSNHSDIIIENCSSGGMRLEYGMLSHTDLASITDQESNRFTGSILYNVSKLIHPSQCGSWSSLKKDFLDDEYAFTLSNSMMGRMHISGDLVNHSDEQLNLIKQATSLYKKYRYILKNPSVYYHSDDIIYKKNNTILAYEYRSENNDSGVIMVSRLNSENKLINIILKNIKEGVYELEFFPTTKAQLIHSDVLMQKGIVFELKNKYNSMFVYYIKIN